MLESSLELRLTLVEFASSTHCSLALRCGTNAIGIVKAIQLMSDQTRIAFRILYLLAK